MANLYRELKIEKLGKLLEWLREGEQTNEVRKLTKRVEQQIAFLKFEAKDDG